MKVSEYADVFLGIVYEGWGDRKRRFDRAHRKVWNYESPIERERYARVIEAVTRLSGNREWENVLEIGCAQGVFTNELASRSRSLTSSDISPLACERTAKRSANNVNVRIKQHDITLDEIPGHYDLVFALDLLEALHGRHRIEMVVHKLAGAVSPGGLLIVSSSRLPENMRDSWWARRLIEGGDNHFALIKAQTDLRSVYEELYPQAGQELHDYPQHLIAIFQKINPFSEPATSKT
jgi:2-polyprenyl-3-methyl-5-hydroxy-6-metoxy-1,4-benzoquinol methylase